MWSLRFVFLSHINNQKKPKKLWSGLKRLVTSCSLLATWLVVAGPDSRVADIRLRLTCTIFFMTNYKLSRDSTLISINCNRRCAYPNITANNRIRKKFEGIGKNKEIIGGMGEIRVPRVARERVSTRIIQPTTFPRVIARFNSININEEWKKRCSSRRPSLEPLTET